MIHSENAYASGQRKRPRGPRSNLAAKPDSSLSLTIHLPSVDLNTQATAYYLWYHLETPQVTSHSNTGLLGTLLPTWKVRSESSILDLAVSSMALATFSRTQHYPPAAVQATFKYHRLLQTVQETVGFLNEDNIDNILLAIFFMGRYEDAIHQLGDTSPDVPFAKRVRSFSHHDGAMAVLKIWKDRFSHCHPPSSIIKLSRRGLIRSTLLRNIAVPEWMRDGSVFGEHGLELEYDSINVRLTNLRQRLCSALSESQSYEFALPTQPDEPNPTITSLDTEAREIDEALQTWKSHFPSSWRYSRHTISNYKACPSSDFYSSRVYSYTDLTRASVWSQYFASRMLTLRTRLQILRLMGSSTDSWAYEQHIQYQSAIHAMSDELAASVPFCLRRFSVLSKEEYSTTSSNSSSPSTVTNTTKSPPSSSRHETQITLNTNDVIKPYLADAIAWPLSIASSLGDLEDGHRAWFRAQLARLGRVSGTGVLECAHEAEKGMKGGWLEL